MPAPQRADIVAEEAMVSWATPNPTMTADLEGWLNYETAENRWYYWNGTSWIKLVGVQVVTSEITDAAVTNAKLANMLQQTLKGRADGAGTGPPTDLDRTASRLVIGASITPSGSIIPITDATTAKLAPGTWITQGADPALLVSTGGGVVKWDGNAANAPFIPMVKTVGGDFVFPKFSGTSLPISPIDGQWFFHTTHQVQYVYSSSATAWLSVGVHEIAFGDNASTASGTFFRQLPIPTSTRYTSTYGEFFGFDVVVVGIAGLLGGSSTCTITVEDDGADVTGGALSFAAETKKATETLLSSVIAANSIIGAKCTSGTASTRSSGKVRFRRREV